MSKFLEIAQLNFQTVKRTLRVLGWNTLEKLYYKLEFSPETLLSIKLQDLGHHFALVYITFGRLYACKKMAKRSEIIFGVFVIFLTLVNAENDNELQRNAKVCKFLLFCTVLMRVCKNEPIFPTWEN